MSEAVEQYPGARIGLPAQGRGSLASWRARFAALLVDWAASMILARLLFGDGVVRGHDWRRFTPMAIYFLEKTVLTALASASFGQLLARIAVVRLDGEPIGWVRSAARAFMKCIIIPAAVLGGDRRALDDLALGTAVVNRR